MNFEVVPYHTLDSKSKEKFFNFLKEVSTSTDPASSNMWGDGTHTLNYLLEKTDRFSNDNGEYHIVFDQEQIVLCGGVYKSSFSKDFAFAGTRLWVNNTYRHNSLVRETLLPYHKKWGVNNGCRAVGLCFNDYNRNIIEIFKRRRVGEIRDRISTRTSDHLFFNGIEEVLFPVTVQYTKQWVIYEKLDPSFDFNWNSIKWTN